MAIFLRNDQQPQKKMGCLGKTIIGIGVYFLFCGIVGWLMGDMMSTPVTILEENTVYRIDMAMINLLLSVMRIFSIVNFFHL